MTGSSDVGSIRTLIMSNSGECQKYNVPTHLENLFSEATRERPNYEKEIKVITKLPNSEQSYKGKVKLIII